MKKRRRMTVMAKVDPFPKSLGNMYFDLDPARGLYQTSALSTPAVANGALVGGMKDQSGRGNDVTTVNASRPMLVTQAVNGRPALWLNSGVPTYLQRATLTGGDLAQPNTIYIVFQQDYFIGARTILDGGAVGKRHAFYQASSKWYINAGTQLGFKTTDSQVHILTAVFNGASSKFWIDGVLVATGDAGANPLNGLTLGASYTQGDNSTGWFIRAVGFHGEHPAAWRAQVEAWLTSLYTHTIPNNLLMTPEPYRIYQRNGSNQGSITITGYASGGVDIEASFNGGAYATIASGVSGAYSGTLSGQAAGQGTLTVRIVGTSIGQSVNCIGVGDLFLLMGQSNCVGQYTTLNAYVHAALKAGLFGNDNLWHELLDPVDSNINQVDAVNLDPTFRGSVWPLLATNIMASTGFPVAFIPANMSATAIASWAPGANHQDRTTLYGSAIYRALQTGGVKGALWWQGESDVIAGTAQATYQAALEAIGDTVNTDLSVPVLAAKIHHNTTWTLANYNNIQNAIGAAYGGHNILAGADLSGISTTYNDLFLDAHAATAAAAWWTALQAAFGWS